jgi:hypothetical protein
MPGCEERPTAVCLMDIASARPMRATPDYLPLTQLSRSLQYAPEALKLARSR